MGALSIKIESKWWLHVDILIKVGLWKCKEKSIDLDSRFKIRDKENSNITDIQFTAVEYVSQ